MNCHSCNALVCTYLQYIRPEPPFRDPWLFNKDDIVGFCKDCAIEYERTFPKGTWRKLSANEAITYEVMLD